MRGKESTLVKYSCPVVTSLNFYLYCIKRIKVVRGWVSKDILRQKVHLEMEGGGGKQLKNKIKMYKGPSKHN